MRRVYLLILAIPVLLTAGGAQCGTTVQGLPVPTACLSFDDVTNIPSGDATGTIDWGTYRAVSNVRTSCMQCELNTRPESKCTDTPLDTTVRTTFTQNGGRLTAEGTDGTTATGGINSDGAFTIGTIATPIDANGTPTGQGLALIEGKFVGNRIIATSTLRATVNEKDGRTTDLSAILNVTFERVE